MEHGRGDPASWGWRYSLSESECKRMYASPLSPDFTAYMDAFQASFKASDLNPQPSTLNPQPSTLNPQPSTLHPQPCTLNPQPSTLNQAGALPGEADSVGILARHDVNRGEMQANKTDYTRKLLSSIKEGASYAEARKAACAAGGDWCVNNRFLLVIPVQGLLEIKDTHRP